MYGLTSQIRRSSSSIPTNIAEGCGRDSQAEMIHFFLIAMGSSSELEYQFILAYDLHYLDETNISQVIKRTRRGTPHAQCVHTKVKSPPFLKSNCTF